MRTKIITSDCRGKFESVQKKTLGVCMFVCVWRGGGALIKDSVARITNKNSERKRMTEEGEGNKGGMYLREKGKAGANGRGSLSCAKKHCASHCAPTPSVFFLFFSSTLLWHWIVFSVAFFLLLSPPLHFFSSHPFLSLPPSL